MKLDDFAQQVDPKIRERGYYYFFDGQVNGPEVIEDGVWVATVYGSEPYRVEIHTDPQNRQVIESWMCSCPYDYGPVCKHVVATLYAMREQDVIFPESEKNSSPKDDIQAIFNKTDEGDLQEFIKTCIKSVDGFKNRFLAHFSDKLDQDPDEHYRNIIRNYAKVAQDRYGFIDYHSASTLTRPLWELNQKADDLLESGNIRHSMTLCQILVEEVAVYIQKMDDSDGGVEDVGRMAFDTLHQIAGDADAGVKEELLDWTMQEFPMQKYHDYGMEHHFLELMPQLVSTSEQEEHFFDLLNRQIAREKESRWSNYRLTQLIKAKVRYLQSRDREQEVVALLEEHSRLPDFREQLVDRALAKNEYKKAKTLCLSGIEHAKEDGYRGIVIRWQKKLYQIAKQQGDVSVMRTWAQTLFLKSYGDMSWYRALKDTFPQQEWPKKCEELIQKIKEPKQLGARTQVYTLAKIFAEEDYTDRLLKLIQANASDINFIDQYAEILKKDYSHELLDLYEQAITNQATQTGRKHYRQIAGWIKNMKKIAGGNERAHDLFKKLLRDYSNRPAMKDEFGKAFPGWKA